MFNAGGISGAIPLVEEGGIVLCALHKQPAHILHAMRGNALQGEIFLETFGGCMRILDGVPAARVQQAMTAPGSSVGDVSLFEQ